MTHREALEVLAAARGDRIVVTTHGSIDLWASLSDTPLDFGYPPASMGQGPAPGLGLALAGPGPAVVWLQVEARPGQTAPSAMRPMGEQVARLRQALGAAL